MHIGVTLNSDFNPFKITLKHTLSYIIKTPQQTKKIEERTD